MVMLVEEARLGLAVVTGYKAGHLIALFPPEALRPNTVVLSAIWLRDNWTRWVFQDIGPEQVEVIGKYEPPEPILNA
jgi:hypothetical protein